MTLLRSPFWAFITLVVMVKFLVFSSDVKLTFFLESKWEVGGNRVVWIFSHWHSDPISREKENILFMCTNNISIYLRRISFSYKFNVFNFLC